MPRKQPKSSARPGRVAKGKSSPSAPAMSAGAALARAGRHAEAIAAASAALAAARRGARPVWLDGGWRDAALYRRLDLPKGAVVPGPAVLDQADTTIVIEGDLVGTVDGFGNLVVKRKAA